MSWVFLRVGCVAPRVWGVTVMTRTLVAAALPTWGATRVRGKGPVGFESQGLQSKKGWGAVATLWAD